MSIYQDLVEQHGFTHRYNSVKRFVALSGPLTEHLFESPSKALILIRPPVLLTHKSLGT